MPHPSYRAMGDIDVLVWKDDLSEAHSVLLDLVPAVQARGTFERIGQERE